MQMNLAEPTLMDEEVESKPKKPKAPSVEEITALFPQLEIQELIGQGGMGAVYKARQKELDRIVAIKVPRKGQLNTQESEQFFREARAAAQLKHPNIVPVHEIGKDGETIYIVSDFVQGISLADRLTGGAIGVIVVFADLYS